jgi:hypothetical protein
MVPELSGTTTVVVPELGGTTTVVVLARGGSLVTQPASIAPRTNKIDAIFIFISSFKRKWSFLNGGIVEPSGFVGYGLKAHESGASHACVCRRKSYIRRFDGTTAIWIFCLRPAPNRAA